MLEPPHSSRVVIAAAVAGAAAGAVVGATLAARFVGRPAALPALGDDDAWLDIAWGALRARTCKPRQSQFRVCAVVVFHGHRKRRRRRRRQQPPRVKEENENDDDDDDCDEVDHNELRFVVGHNDEACSLPNSVCAERAAFLKLATLLSTESGLDGAARPGAWRRRLKERLLRRLQYVAPSSTLLEPPLPPSVLAVYLVSDAPDAITPGALCREFMSSSPLVRTSENHHGRLRVVMEGGAASRETRRESTLEQLWPLPSPFTRLSSTEQRAEGIRIGRLLQSQPGNSGGSGSGSGEEGRSQSEEKRRRWNGNPLGPIEKARRAATAAAISGNNNNNNNNSGGGCGGGGGGGDSRDELHPVRLGAAVVFADGAVRVAWQRKALEYSCSLDPVCLLAPALEEHGIPSSPPHTMRTEALTAAGKHGKDGSDNNNNNNSNNSNDERGDDGDDDEGLLRSGRGGRSAPAVLCMCDQFGVCHAPFAIGRAYLVEHGWAAVTVLCHDRDGVLHTPTAEALMPGIPLMGQLSNS